MKCLGTGLSGLVGSRVTQLLAPRYSFEDLSLDTGVDITNRELIYPRIATSDAGWVLHFAAKTDVDSCEQERDLGRDSQAWKINVIGTQYIVEACRESHKKLLYISTDFVFDGTKDAYVESDCPQPANFYGLTKYEGERLVASLDNLALIVRISFPYRAVFPIKLDLVRAILSRLASGSPIMAVTDQHIVPTFIDDIAGALDVLMSKNARGIYHVCGSQFISPFELSRQIAQQFGYETVQIKPVTRQEYFAGRAYRPFQTTLKNDKIRFLGVSMRRVNEGLREMKKQLAQASKTAL